MVENKSWREGKRNVAQATGWNHEGFAITDHGLDGQIPT